MKRLVLSVALVALFATACDQATTDPEPAVAPDGAAEALFKNSKAASANAEVSAALVSIAREKEAEMQAQFPNARLAGIQWLGDPNDGQMGGEIFFEDRGNKQLPVGWVALDPRRGGRTNMLWSVDISIAPVGLAPDDLEDAVSRAMETWANTTACSNLPFVQVPVESDLWDILHAGFVLLPPGVLGMTLPFAFTGSDGHFTDIDGDGRVDYAFAVIVYQADEGFWGIDVTDFPFVDFESVAFHETGHGLGQAHFGKAFINKAGKVQISPRAVMNAGYSGLQQSLTGTDMAGHCSDWGSWPNR